MKDLTSSCKIQRSNFFFFNNQDYDTYATILTIIKYNLWNQTFALGLKFSNFGFEWKWNVTIPYKYKEKSEFCKYIYELHSMNLTILLYYDTVI